MRNPPKRVFVTTPDRKLMDEVVLGTVRGCPECLTSGTPLLKRNPATLSRNMKVLFFGILCWFSGPIGNIK